MKRWGFFVFALTVEVRFKNGCDFDLGIRSHGIDVAYSSPAGLAIPGPQRRTTGGTRRLAD
jgi:hypothetical protein